jgi:formate hydrogenlyase subunit 3/multisubunit Na+/H+ antiporter MnhD subunit
MLSKIKNILTYYDSEPTEIMQGVVWLIIFPVIYTIEHGLNLFLIIPSILIGFCSIYSVCYHSLKTRKTIALAVLLFSIVSVTMYIIKGDYVCPTHWVWGLISFSAFFNSKRICNHYYRSIGNG